MLLSLVSRDLVCDLPSALAVKVGTEEDKDTCQALYLSGASLCFITPFGIMGKF